MNIEKKKEAPVSRAIELSEFDREYDLSELLPTATLEDIEVAFSKTGPYSFSVLWPDGETYYVGSRCSTKHLMLLRKALPENRLETTNQYDIAGHKAVVMPIWHEFEILGYAILINTGQTPESAHPMRQIGIFILKFLHRLISETYRNRLTSNLHGEVVETSYRRLQAKAKQLEESERKYRKLAEHLEREVARKTAIIQDHQGQLMLQEKMATIGRIAAGLAHEINTPIGFIHSNLYTLKEYIGDICELSDICKSLEAAVASSGGDAISRDIRTAGNRLKQIRNDNDIDFILNDAGQIVCESLAGADRIAAIVSHLKLFSAIDTPGETHTNINDCIDNTLVALSASIPEGAAIIKRYAELPTAVCFVDEINQAFMNILLNAFQAIGDGGRVIISTGLHDSQGSAIQISIEDTGIGIPTEHLAHVFDPFFTTRSVGDGVGIGLTTAQNILHHHNGEICLTSTPGKGTVVKILLPLKENK